jgi:hypothetical protein
MDLTAVHHLHGLCIIRADRVVKVDTLDTTTDPTASVSGFARMPKHVPVGWGTITALQKFQFMLCLGYRGQNCNDHSPIKAEDFATAYSAEPSKLYWGVYLSLRGVLANIWVHSYQRSSNIFDEEKKSPCVLRLLESSDLQISDGEHPKAWFGSTRVRAPSLDATGDICRHCGALPAW